MNRSQSLRALILFTSLLAASAPFARADEPAVPYLTQVTPKQLAGPEVKAAQYKGRVVVVANWGTKCESCWWHIPQLVGWAKRYPTKRVVVVANNIYGDEVLKKWVAAGYGKSNVVLMDFGGFGTKSFTVAGKRPPVLSPGKEGVFHLWIYDAYGRLAFEGLPDGKCDKALAAAANAAPLSDDVLVQWNAAEALLGGPVHPALLEQACELANTIRSSAPAVGKLKTLSTGKETDLADAAKGMLEKFDVAVANEFKEALDRVAEEPATSCATMEKLARWVPQKDEGAKAATQLNAWRADKTFQVELIADKAWLQLRAKALAETQSKNWVKPSAGLESETKSLIQRYAGTKAAAKAKAALEAGWKSDPVVASPAA